MKDFEKFLAELPRPDVELPEFRRSLLRELRHREAHEARRAPWVALRLSFAASIALGLLLGVFVARPAIPAALNQALFGTAMPEPGAPATMTTATPVDLDREFVESWTSKGSRPAAIRSVEAERRYTVRQFELSDGKRMLVFSELDAEPAPLPVTRVASNSGLF